MATPVRRAALGSGAVSLALLSACVTPQPRPLPVADPDRIELATLSGWVGEDHAAALAAYRQGCGPAREPAQAALCAEARAISIANPRAWFEQRFVAAPLGVEGLLTGYYSPEYPARRAPDAAFSAPVRPRPADLVDATPYLDRASIEAQVEPRPLAWMRPEELFFLQIQGSGSLVFEDGRRARATYAATNGRPFIGLAKLMRERGQLADDQTSAANIQAWLAARRGPEADALMRENPRYVFFRLESDDGTEPQGAAGVALPAGRSIAVDPAHQGYGLPLWIDADAGALAGAFPSYRRTVMALDTGGAIRGAVRADLYIGRGAPAGVEAGRIRHRLRMWRLVPR